MPLVAPPIASALQEDMILDKSASDHVEAVSDPNVEKAEPGFQRDAKLDRKVVLKLDLLLMPIMAALFVFLFLDRGNIGNARVAGMQKDIGISDYQYQLSLTITYIPYILIEIPSNLLLKKIGPRIMLPALCCMWGTVTTFQGLITNFGGIVTCRFMLGLCEGGLFPGFVLYLSEFYLRHELQTRIGLIYGAASVSGAFSGLLAAAIVQMNGLSNLAGWRWLFLIEGVVTVAFGLFAFFILPNNPREVLTLSPTEAEYCIQRHQFDAKITTDDKITKSAVLSAFKDWHVINIAAISFCNGVVIGGLAYFTPSVVQALGYGATTTQLLSVPPYGFALILTLVAAQFADRFHRRGYTAMATLSLAIIGFAINLSTTSIAARYVAICLNVASIYSTAPSLLTWIPNNSATYGKRATAIAIGFVTSNCAGIIATWIYPTSDAPRYLFAARFNISIICIEMVLLVIQVVLLKRLNKNKELHREQILASMENKSLDEQMEVLGDHHPDFKYTL